MNATATRTNGVITVTLPGGKVRTINGKRAAAAEAVMVGQWSTDGAWAVTVSSSVAAARKAQARESKPAYEGGPRLTNTAVIVL